MSGTEKGHRFGGDWTMAKLNVVVAYLTNYTTALRDRPSKMRPFRKAYIDAFAGTGYRDVRQEENAETQPLLFPDLAEREPQELLDGSARLALQTTPRFDKYNTTPQTEEHAISPGGEGHCGELCVFLEEAIGI
jgi:three-Cys-motif partner protein